MRSGVTTGDMVKIDAQRRGRSTIAAYVMPGQPVGVITLAAGLWPARAAGHIGDELGFNTYAIRTSDRRSIAGASASQQGRRHLQAGRRTQDHYMIDTIGVEGTDKRIGGKNESGMIIHEATLAEFKEESRPSFTASRERYWPCSCFRSRAMTSSTTRTPGAWRST